MKISVIGTGLIGSQVVSDLTAAGHDATGHSRSTGVDLLTGDGLDDAVRGAEVVVDVTNSPTFDDAAIGFFRTTVTRLLAAAQVAGARHIVTLSITGADLVPGMAYYRAKTLQENLVKAGPVPYSIVRATQFMEFIAPAMDCPAAGHPHHRRPRNLHPRRTGPHHPGGDRRSPPRRHRRHRRPVRPGQG